MASSGTNGYKYATLDGIDESIRSLIQESIKGRGRAYAPYSKFQVGAALLTSEGQIFLGCNIENISFGLTVCAERTAVLKAVSEGQKDFKAIAVSAILKDEVATPCGACRQVLAEFNPRLPVYLHNPKTDKVVITTLTDLLPNQFNPEVVTL